MYVCAHKIHSPVGSHTIARLQLVASCVSSIMPYSETLESHCRRWKVASYNFQTLCLLYGPNMELGVELNGDKSNLVVTLKEDNPHYLLGPHLQNLLNKSRSIPLLLQGMATTLSTVRVFHTLNIVHLKRQQVGQTHRHTLTPTHSHSHTQTPPQPYTDPHVPTDPHVRTVLYTALFSCLS